MGSFDVATLQAWDCSQSDDSGQAEPTRGDPTSSPRHSGPAAKRFPLLLALENVSCQRSRVGDEPVCSVFVGDAQPRTPTVQISTSSLKRVNRPVWLTPPSWQRCEKQPPHPEEAR